MKQQINNMTVEEKRIKALIIQYDDIIRYRKKLLDCDLAEALLSIIPICMKNRDTFEAELKEKTDECELLKIHLDTAREKVAKLYAKYEKDTRVKEFLDFAIFLSTFRDSGEETGTGSNDFLPSYDISSENYIEKESTDFDEHESKATSLLRFDEPTDECRLLKTSPIVANEDILSLNSTLGKAYELLNSEILRRKEAEKGRDNLEYLSERLCCLLLKYEELVKTRVTNSPTSRDHLNVRKIQENDFSSKNEYQFPLLPSSSFQDDIASVENIDSEVILSERNAHSLEAPNETFNLSAGSKLLKSESVEESSLSSSLIASAQSHLKNEQSDVPATEVIRNLNSTQDESDLIHTNVAVQASSEPLKMKRKRAPSKTSGVHCDICGLRISNQDHLNRHILHVHDKVKPYVCPLCNKRFSRREHLKKHDLMMHIVKKIFNCPICNQHFDDSSTNILHQQIAHDADAPLQCMFCDIRCTEKSFMISHTRMQHFADLPGSFKCSMCDIRFRNSYHKKRHEWRIHNRNSGDFFHCPHCTKIYRLEENLSRHLQNSHAQ